MVQERYLIIPEWMVDLGLNTAERDAYALIWGFCQDGESDFHGSAAYIARWCGVTERQAHTILKNLTSRGLIKKTAEPGYPAHYSTTGCAITAQGGEEIAPLKNLHGGYEVFSYPTPEEISPNNKERDNKRDNKDTQSLPRTREDLNAYGEFVRMSAENYARLVTRFGADDAARLCEILDAYLAKKPNAYRDHYRAALGWPVQRLQEEKLNQQRLKNAQEAGQRAATPQQQYSGYGAVGLAASKRLEELLKQN